MVYAYRVDMAWSQLKRYSVKRKGLVDLRN